MRLLRFNQLKDKGIPWCRLHVDRKEKDGTFPKRVKLGANTIAWREDEIDAWLADRVKQRTPAQEEQFATESEHA